MEKLNVGCGCNILEGWMNVDLYYKNPNIINLDLLNLPDEWKDKYDEILCRHVLEHIPYNKLDQAFSTLHHILKPGGKCVISVPDMDYYTELFYSCKDATLLKGWAFKCIFGTQEHEGEFHKSGFTETTFKHHLTKAGFTINLLIAAWGADQKTFVAECTK